jgi:hypothetical protein
MVISRMTRVKMRPLLASVAAFLCLIVAHFECPDMRLPRFDLRARRREFQLVRDLAAVYAGALAGKSSPAARPTRRVADTQITMRRPSVNCKTPRNPSSLAQPATPRNEYTFLGSS